MLRRGGVESIQRDRRKFAARGRFVAPLLFEVSPHDPLTLGVVVATLPAIAVAASWIPGWRAPRVDPSEALRAD